MFLRNICWLSTNTRRYIPEDTTLHRLISSYLKVRLDFISSTVSIGPNFFLLLNGTDVCHQGGSTSQRRNLDYLKINHYRYLQYSPWRSFHEQRAICNSITNAVKKTSRNGPGTASFLSSPQGQCFKHLRGLEVSTPPWPCNLGQSVTCFGKLHNHFHTITPLERILNKGAAIHFFFERAVGVGNQNVCSQSSVEAA
jgi:hypothetical protein